MKLTFRIVDGSDSQVAFGWHRGFAEASQAIYPRGKDFFSNLVYDRRVWCAVDDGGQFLAMSYIDLHDPEGWYEVGGLMVSPRTRGLGIDGIMLRLPMAYTLATEGLPPEPCPAPVVTHVLAGNDAPRSIMRSVGFHHAKTVEIPAGAMPGLKSDEDGLIRGDEFHLSKARLPDLAEWCETWAFELRDGSGAAIDLLEGFKLADIGTALRDL